MTAVGFITFISDQGYLVYLKNVLSVRWQAHLRDPQT